MLTSPDIWFYQHVNINLWLDTAIGIEFKQETQYMTPTIKAARSIDITLF